MVTTHPTPPVTSDPVSEVTPLIGAVPFYGPPVVLFAVPWLAVGLLLSGPVAALLAVIAALLVAAALLAGIALLLAAPFLLVRRVRRAHAPVARPAIDLRRVTA